MTVTGYVHRAKEAILRVDVKIAADLNQEARVNLSDLCIFSTGPAGYLKCSLSGHYIECLEVTVVSLTC